MGKAIAARNVTHAARIIKRMMRLESEGWPGVQEMSRWALRRALQAVLRERRLSYLETEAPPGDRANGHYRRHLLTSVGDIELSIPRTRRWSARRVLAAYARRAPEVDHLILAAFLLGLSTRKVGEALLPILGERVSAATVSRVARALDGAVEGFHRRRLRGRWRAVVFDGVVLGRKTGAGSLRRPVLVALGIREDGRKEVLDFRLAPGESERAWEAFLTDLWRRGLRAEVVELVVADGGKGLRAAMEVVFPELSVQLCWAHKVRNVLDKMRRGDREVARRDLRRIYEARGLREARRAARRFADRWEAKAPRAVACLRRDLGDLLHFLAFEEEGWRRAVRTTNAIERLFREVRRRTRPMGVFSDRTSMERILYAVFARHNQHQGTGAPFLALTQNT